MQVHDYCKLLTNKITVRVFIFLTKRLKRRNPNLTKIASGTQP